MFQNPTFIHTFKVIWNARENFDNIRIGTFYILTLTQRNAVKFLYEGYHS